jgi:AcrR family transcriptional regulator
MLTIGDVLAKDRRVQKTRRLLLRALGELLHEKRYETIVVQQILDRANVGRSTFYAHFRDKDDLLQNALHELLHFATRTTAPVASRSEEVLRFSRPMFEHVELHLRASKQGLPLRSRTVVHERLRRALEERVTQDVSRATRRAASGEVPRELLVRHVTATFVLVLEWWVGQRSRLSAAEVDGVFRSLVQPVLAEALGG